MPENNPTITKHRQCLRELDYQVRSNRPLIYVVSAEERRVRDAVRVICQRNDHRWNLIEWDVANGISSITADGPELPENPVLDQQQVLRWFSKLPKSEPRKYTVLVLKDFFKFIGADGRMELLEHKVIRQLINLSEECIGMGKVIVITGTSFFLPPELEKIAAIVDWPLPEREHIADKVSKMLGHAAKEPDLMARGFRVDYTPQEHEEIVRAFQGMTIPQIEFLCTYSMLKENCLSPQLIASEKRKLVRALACSNGSKYPKISTRSAGLSI
jgi:hypothetical protein